MSRCLSNTWVRGSPKRRLDRFLAASVECDHPRLTEYARAAIRWTEGMDWRGDALALQRARASSILREVQRLPYVPAPSNAGADLVKPPLVVLVEGGDCDELGVLSMTLDALVGIVSRMVWLPLPGEDLDHVCPQVLINGIWLWTENTVMGALLGEDPIEAKARVSEDERLQQWLDGQPCACELEDGNDD